MATKMEEQRKRNFGILSGSLSYKARRKKAETKAELDARKAAAKKAADRKSKAKKMMANEPKGSGGKAANLKSRVKDSAPLGRGAKKISGFKRVLTKDPDAGRKQQSQTKKKSPTVKDKAPPSLTGSVAAAQKSGDLYFKGKDGKSKLAITSAQLKKSGMTLSQFANKYKKKGIKAFLADLKKMAMGGAAMKKKGYAMGGSMKKKGYAMGGSMKKKGYAMGGLKATSPSQTGLKKLPSSVRNKMGYMMKGGLPKKSHGKAGKKGYAMGGMTKKKK